MSTVNFTLRLCGTAAYLAHRRLFSDRLCVVRYCESSKCSAARPFEDGDLLVSQSVTRMIGSVRHPVLTAPTNLVYNDLFWYVLTFIIFDSIAGIILKKHYAFYWCSPTRRSFLWVSTHSHSIQAPSTITTRYMYSQWTLRPREGTKVLSDSVVL